MINFCISFAMNNYFPNVYDEIWDVIKIFVAETMKDKLSFAANENELGFELLFSNARC